jgi:hypothetical protein
VVFAAADFTRSPGGKVGKAQAKSRLGAGFDCGEKKRAGLSSGPTHISEQESIFPFHPGCAGVTTEIDDAIIA